MRLMRRVRAQLGQRARYAHSLRVARFAERLAAAHGEDPAQARVAGLLHDLARLYSAAALLKECDGQGLTVDAFEGRNPIVLHARLGAHIACRDYGVRDEAILSAIRKHTVAAERMSRLDQIIYLADGLEPGRSFAERTEFARLALADLSAAMREVIGSTIGYLQSRGLEVAPATWAAARTFALPVTSVSEEHLEIPSLL